MSTVTTILRALYKIGYEVCPIILQGGIASGIPGGLLPIIALTESLNFTNGLLHGANPLNLDDFLCHFKPIPGSTLINQQIGQYPFANQAVAANATIAQPLRISLVMDCPPKGPGGMAVKISTMLALKKALDVHNSQGGTYIVLTPGGVYNPCILTALTDVSDGSSRNPQIRYQWDFIRPLLALDEANQVLNSLMRKLAAGVQQPTGGLQWSGPDANLNVPGSGVTPSIIPSATSVAGVIS